MFEYGVWEGFDLGVYYTIPRPRGRFRFDPGYDLKACVGNRKIVYKFLKQFVFLNLYTSSIC